MKIQTKVLVTLASVIATVGIGTTMVSRNISRNTVVKQIHDRLETVAQSRAHHIETFLEAEKEAVKQLSESIVIERFFLAGKKDHDYLNKRNDVMRRLEHTARIGKYTYDIFVLDKNGIITASSDEQDIGKDKSDNSYFLCGKQSVFIKDVHVSSHKGRRALAFAAPLFDEEAANFLGVVVIRISTKRLNEITMDRTGLGETGEIYLVNKDGYMITPSRFADDAFLKRKVDTENARDCFEDVELFGTQKHEHEVISCRNYLGTDVLGVHAHIPEMEWGVLAEISAKEAFAPVARLTRTMLSILAALLVGGAILSILLSRTLTKPIVKLHHGTEEIERGNLDYKVGTQAKDEIGQLSRAFDNMTDQLKKSKEELEEYSKGLEEKVEKRTAQLKEQFARSEKQKMAMLNISQDLEETNKNLQAGITKRKKAEARLKQTLEELERSNTELQQFAYVASHDLQEPLRMVASYVQLLGKRYKGKLDGDADEFIDYAVDGAGRMQGLINALLDYSRVGTRGRPFEFTDCDAVLDRATANLQAAIVEIGARVEHDPLPTVMADGMQLTQLFQNLIGNAIKFHNQKPPHIYISAQKKGHEWLLSVRDNGIGIDSEYAERIFFVFQRLHNRSEYKGTGIGLAICRKIVERHGGRIWVESKPGKGSTFYFTIPE